MSMILYLFVIALGDVCPANAIKTGIFLLKTHFDTSKNRPAFASLQPDQAYCG